MAAARGSDRALPARAILRSFYSTRLESPLDSLTFSPFDELARAIAPSAASSRRLKFFRIIGPKILQYEICERSVAL